MSKHPLSFEAVHGFIKWLNTRKESFSIHSTGYTKTIIWKGDKFTFLDNASRNTFVFPCFNKIKSDIKKSNVIIDKVPRFNIEYFGANDFLKRIKGDYSTEVINIDLCSAYLTTLLNAKLITEDTFNYVAGADKATRLKAVGMLATNKVIFNFENGKLKSHSFACDEVMRNYFFYCCYEVGQVMRQVADIAGQNFYFFWVDGIYLSGDFDEKLITTVCEEKGYKVKTKRLENCTFANQEKSLHFSYFDEKAFKVFNVPFYDSEERKKIDYFLNYIKNESNINAI